VNTGRAGRAAVVALLATPPRGRVAPWEAIAAILERYRDRREVGCTGHPHEEVAAAGVAAFFVTPRHGNDQAVVNKVA